jgi:hypothetical protein
VGRFFPHSFIDFLRSEDLFAVGKSASHAMADRVRIFALKRQNVSQKGFNALVHWFSPSSYSFATREAFDLSGEYPIYEMANGRWGRKYDRSGSAFS